MIKETLNTVELKCTHTPVYGHNFSPNLAPRVLINLFNIQKNNNKYAKENLVKIQIESFFINILFEKLCFGYSIA